MIGSHLDPARPEPRESDHDPEAGDDSYSWELRKIASVRDNESGWERLEFRATADSARFASLADVIQKCGEALATGLTEVSARDFVIPETDAGERQEGTFKTGHEQD